MTKASGEDIAAALREFVCEELLGQPEYPLGDDDPLVTGGLIDSFSIAYIGTFIEQRFGVYIPDPELTVENMDTIRQIADRVAADSSA